MTLSLSLDLDFSFPIALKLNQNTVPISTYKHDVGGHNRVAIQIL